MIITKGVVAGEVVTMKIVTGEELVGKLTEISDTHYSVQKPLVLVMSPQGLGFQQWSFTADTAKPFKISKDKVIMIAETFTEIKKQYTEGTTGLTLL